MTEFVSLKTWDKWTNQRFPYLHPKIRADYVNAVNESYERGYKVRLTGDGHLRLFKEQDILYGHSRTREQLIEAGVNPDYAQPNLSWKTNATGGDSSHNYGLGTDSCIIDGNNAIFDIPKEVVDIFKKHGFEWMFDKIGKDKPHFQKLFGYTINELKKKYLSKDVDSKGYVNL